ncbi:hypothetical protein AXF42_Ash007619 [Apostasia shenzhenica]|uniref:Uncharacterized protein n=1 Tax=Apostasia shenzhenica TaxID=1088818 RepID=A0A2I0A601_9ASPA|nr:hypothetical protein AXF42_Ash007619 [Apostasia shenzhenica]
MMAAGRDLDEPPQQPPEHDCDSPILMPIVLLLLTVNAAVSIYRARRDPRNLAFVVFAYAALSALIACVLALERRRAEAAEGPGTGKLRVAVWGLAAALSGCFVWRVAETVPPALAAAAWVLEGVFSIVSFCALVLYQPASGSGEAAEDVCGYRKLPLPEELA